MNNTVSHEDILEGYPHGVFAVNNESQITYANTAAQNQLHVIFQGSLIGASLEDIGLPSVDTIQANMNHKHPEHSLNFNFTPMNNAANYIVAIEENSLDFNAQLPTLIENLSKGRLSSRLSLEGLDQQSTESATLFNSYLDTLEQGMQGLLHDVQFLADCNFRSDIETSKNGIFGHFNGTLNTTFSNLNESLKQTVLFSKIIGDASTNIAKDNQELAIRTEQQSSELEATSASMEELSSTVKHNAENATRASDLAKSTHKLVGDGQTSVAKMVTAMESVKKSSKKIEGIIGVINEIAFQTNILSLNAAVEAARAGEHGRGFAVVAEEVRNLAQRSASAAKEIRTLISESGDIITSGQNLAINVQNQMVEIVESMDETNELMSEISTATKEQSTGIELANNAIGNIDSINQQNAGLVQRLNKNTANMDQKVNFLIDTANIFHLREETQGPSHPLHTQAIQIAKQGAVELSAVLEQAVQMGQATYEQIFSRDYQLIEGTEPPKHTTAFDSLTDQIFTGIQEQILEQNTFLVLAAATDNNGYIPTHNLCFSKPLTGDLKADLVGNRTKRIFSDRVGVISGSNTEEFILQTYRRDTGELMFDVSAPITAGGQYWGALRVGYKID